MCEEMLLQIDSEYFKKLIVPAYVTKDSYNPLYQNLLITRNANTIISYATDLYQSYRVCLDIDENNIDISENFRVCLNAEFILNTIKPLLKSNTSVLVGYIKGKLYARLEVGTSKFLVPTYAEGRNNEFNDFMLDSLFNSVLEDEPVQSKIFNLSLFEQMCKAIKTAINSSRERKNLSVTCVRSGERHADLFNYGGWISALVMPLRK